MHDETFLVIRGTATFTSRENKIVAKAGDYIVVPTCAPHTFGNEHDEELVLYNTFSPAFYLDYFRLLGAMAEKEGGKLTPAAGKEAMVRYATLQTGITQEW